MGWLWAGWLFLRPVTAFADEPQKTTNDTYLEQMKAKYGVKPEAIEGMDWFIAIGGVVGTVICTGVFIYWFSKVLLRLWQITTGQARLADTAYWKRMGIGLLIIMLFMSGALFAVMEKWWVLMQLWEG